MNQEIKKTWERPYEPVRRPLRIFVEYPDPAAPKPDPSSRVWDNPWKPGRLERRETTLIEDESQLMEVEGGSEARQGTPVEFRDSQSSARNTANTGSRKRKSNSFDDEMVQSAKEILTTATQRPRNLFSKRFWSTIAEFGWIGRRIDMASTLANCYTPPRKTVLSPTRSYGT